MDHTKATILKIGTANTETGKASGWSIDGRGEVSGITIKEDGNHLFGGYTVAELAEIAESGMEPPINAPEEI